MTSVGAAPRIFIAAVGILFGLIAAVFQPLDAGATFPGRSGQIALVRDFKNGSSRQVYVGTRKGTLRPVAPGIGFTAGPDFSPSGRRLVFAGRRGETAMR